MAKTAPRVALLIETSRGYGRGLLRGIARYARLHGPWSFYVSPGDFEQAVPVMADWKGAGIIARVENRRVERALLEAGVPVITLDLSEAQLRRESALGSFCEVRSDSWQAARLAAEHLLDRGFRHCGFVGIPGRIWSKRREESFRERLREAGLEPRVYGGAGRTAERRWDVEQSRLARWLHDLPRPCGVMACNDDRGRQVLEACRIAGLRVPEEVAVIGVDNDELLCELADPPLSSVALNAEHGGYLAAELLDALMRGKVRKRRTITVEPLYVVTRRSTDVVSIEDRDVAEALSFIHAHATDPILVADVVRHVRLSRRTIEQRFRRALGRSVHHEILRVRLERAQRLLSESDLSMGKVAAFAGFGSASYLSQVFRERLKTTPARYRQQSRTR